MTVTSLPKRTMWLLAAFASVSVCGLVVAAHPDHYVNAETQFENFQDTQNTTLVQNASAVACENVRNKALDDNAAEEVVFNNICNNTYNHAVPDIESFVYDNDLFTSSPAPQSLSNGGIMPDSSACACFGSGDTVTCYTNRKITGKCRDPYYTTAQYEGNGFSYTSEAAACSTAITSALNQDHTEANTTCSAGSRTRDTHYYWADPYGAQYIEDSGTLGVDNCDCSQQMGGWQCSIHVQEVGYCV